MRVHLCALCFVGLYATRTVLEAQQSASNVFVLLCASCFVGLYAAHTVLEAQQSASRLIG